LSRFLSLSREIEKINIDNKTSKLLGESDIASQQLLKDTIRLIQRTETEFNEKNINKWFEEKKIPNETHLPVFKRLLK
jgi:hypothetical protein